MTLFPQMVSDAFLTSITGRAVRKGIVDFSVYDIRDYTKDKNNRVDDYPFGGGAGLVMQAQPVYDCFRDVAGHLGNAVPRVIFMSPAGRVFDQKTAHELADEDHIIFLCGHYEGVDERVLEEIKAEKLSIGDYVLTGGELPALVVSDAVIRLIPGVLHNGESIMDESFETPLLEYPQYSRPAEWMGRQVPPELMTGDHKSVALYRRKLSEEITKEVRPDLYERYLSGLERQDRRSELQKSIKKLTKKIKRDLK
ncbi:MAG: tRNA (guanosine(37)-N1)-methyltransferase TrmD [Lachnospiraceae bacterium]|nr:tRNA (guanosine(37)-N1)-methyltransferase TrmD [Lachnospiraceae bacterium]